MTALEGFLFFMLATRMGFAWYVFIPAYFALHFLLSLFRTVTSSDVAAPAPDRSSDKPAPTSTEKPYCSSDLLVRSKMPVAWRR